MKTILVKKDGRFNIPEEHRISKENRILRVKGEFYTQCERVLKGDMQTQIQFWAREKSRKTHKGLIEINGTFYKIVRETKQRGTNNE